MASHGEHQEQKGALGRIWTRKWSFLAVFALVFLVSFRILDSVGLVPDPAVSKEAERPRQTASVLDSLPVETPVRILIPDAGIEVAVLNPSSTDVKTLDAALLKGAVRYPSSARLGEKGNTILFGHSSYLPVVSNQNYKAFNAIQHLEKGDRITVEGAGHAYVYAVDNVYKANAERDAIPLTSAGRTLTLVTCDSFASKADRFVVVATLVESYPVAN